MTSRTDIRAAGEPPVAPPLRLRIIRITHPEDEEVPMSFLNIEHIVSVYFHPVFKYTCIVMVNGDVHHCTESLDRILTQIRTPG
jgi:hypothetical protein